MVATIAFSSRTKPVGCQRDALMALTGALDEVGNGLFKRVYANTSRTVVYKVARAADKRDGSITEGRRKAIVAEAAWIALGRDRRVPGIPHATLWVVNGQPVLAMPFVTYSTGDLRDLLTRNEQDRALDAADVARVAWRRLGLEDLHEGNVRYDARLRPIVTDLGGWGYDAPITALPEDARTLESDVYDGEEPCDDWCDCTKCVPSHFTDPTGNPPASHVTRRTTPTSVQRPCGPGMHRVAPSCGWCLVCERPMHDVMHGPTMRDMQRLMNPPDGDTNWLRHVGKCGATNDAWPCTLPVDHAGDHEAWITPVTRPVKVWPPRRHHAVRPTNVAVRCNRGRNDFTKWCALPAGHWGRHEAWVWYEQDPVIVWGRNQNTNHGPEITRHSKRQFVTMNTADYNAAIDALCASAIQEAE